MRAINDNIIVQLEKRQERTASGLFLAGNVGNDDNVKYARVINVSDSSDFPALKTVKEGDSVWFNKYNSHTITFNGEEYIALDIRNVLAVNSAE